MVKILLPKEEILSGTASIPVIWVIEGSVLVDYVENSNRATVDQSAFYSLDNRYAGVS
jgi:hypothetical protein